MARTGITDYQVEEVAEKILATGENPTIDKVRRALGDTGSNSVISRHLRNWKEQRLRSPAPINEKDIPDPLQQTVAAVWQQVRAEMQAENERLQTKAEQSIAIAQQECEAAIKEAQQLRITLENTSLKINGLETDLQIMKKELVKERQQCEVESMRANKAEELAIALQSETKSHLDNLKQSYETNLSVLLEQQEKDKVAYRADLIQYRDLLEDQRVQFMVKLDEYKTAQEQTIKQLAQAEVESKRQQEQVIIWMEKARVLEVDLTIAKEQNTIFSK